MFLQSTKIIISSIVIISFLQVSLKGQSRSELGLLSGFGGSEILEIRKFNYHLYRSTGLYDNNLAPSFNVGAYYKGVFHSGLYAQFELFYGRITEYKSIEDETLYTRSSFSSSEAGTLNYAELKIHYNTLNFPLKIGYERQTWFVEAGIGGLYLNPTASSIQADFIENGVRENFHIDSNANGYNFLHYFYVASVGARLSERLNLNISTIRSHKSKEQERFHNQYTIGLSYAIKQKKFSPRLKGKGYHPYKEN